MIFRKVFKKVFLFGHNLYAVKYRDHEYRSLRFIIYNPITVFIIGKFQEGFELLFLFVWGNTDIVEQKKKKKVPLPQLVFLRSKPYKSESKRLKC